MVLKRGMKECLLEMVIDMVEMFMETVELFFTFMYIILWLFLSQTKFLSYMCTNLGSICKLH